MVLVRTFEPVKATGLLSFVLMAFGSITKGMETQHLCLWFLIQYSQGEGTTVLDRI